MEMGSNDIMGEPEENTGDEGREVAEPDTAAWRCIKPLKDFNAVVTVVERKPEFREINVY